MHSLNLKVTCLAIIVVHFFGIANSTKPDLSGWQEIVDKVTDFARDIGYPRAGQECGIFGKDLERCVVIEDGNVEEVPFLECSKIFGAFGVGIGECKVKGWAVFLLISAAILIPLSLIMGLACCCMRC